MRTAKRFTPAVLARFRKEGRGSGTYSDYIPWHGVSRGDPASRGRSHLHIWRGRQQALLSDIEWECLLFTSLLPNVVDSLEQRQLSLHPDIHDLSKYVMVNPRDKFPGTLELAARMGIKHPLAKGKSEVEPWVLTTDRLVVFNSSGARSLVSLLAIAAKPKDALTKRKSELLQLERLYWEVRNVPWMLFTPKLYEPRVSDLLRSTAAWAFDEPVSLEAQETACSIQARHPASSLHFNLRRLAGALGSMELAQRAFWQAVWSEALPLDLRMGWNPNFCYPALSLAEYRNLNPVGMRRSSWN